MTETTEPIRSTTEIEVRYIETDQMGVVHHANYVAWFELARTHLCALSGYRYADIETLGYLLMVTGVEVRYRRPARYGETVAVICWGERLMNRRHRPRLDRGRHRPPLPHPRAGARAIPAAGGAGSRARVGPIRSPPRSVPPGVGCRGASHR
jgi:YbgC/YbaW family acyl-CoA thioester hydrolase